MNKKKYILEMPEFNSMTLQFKCNKDFIDYLLASFERISDGNESRQNVIKSLKTMRENCEKRIWVNVQLSDERVPLSLVIDHDPMFTDDDFKV